MGLMLSVAAMIAVAEMEAGSDPAAQQQWSPSLFSALRSADVLQSLSALLVGRSAGRRGPAPRRL